MLKLDIKESRYGIGDIIVHRLFGYRGVIVDIDPIYMGSEDWYQGHAKTQPPKDQPWYHILVDGQVHNTYAAERNLFPDISQEPVEHPLVPHIFSELKDGHYINQAQFN